LKIKLKKDLTIFHPQIKFFFKNIFYIFSKLGQVWPFWMPHLAILDVTVIRNLKSVHIFFKFLNHEKLLSLFRVLFKIFLA